MSLEALLGLLALALVFAPIVSLVLGVMARSRIKELERRVEKLELERSRTRTSETAPSPTPAPEREIPPPSPEPMAPIPRAHAASVAPESPTSPPPPEPVGSPEMVTNEEVDEAVPPVERESVSALARLREARERRWESESEPAVTKTPGLPRDVERLLGGSIFVWVGGIALALAGAFLVKYSFDQGWLGPMARVILGGLFGITLVVFAERLHESSSRVAEALMGAGIATLYAVLLAATNLYDLLPSVLGFAGMALVTAGAVAGALRHGPYVAALGLAGGFLTPALIDTGNTRTEPLFLYLFLLQAGLLAVARRRPWWPIAALTVVAAHAWVLYAMWRQGPGEGDPVLGLFVLASTAMTFWACDAEVEGGLGLSDFWRMVLTWVAVGAGLLSTASLLTWSRYSAHDWGFLLLLCIGSLVVARLREKLHGLAWFAFAMSYMVFLLAGETSHVSSKRLVILGLLFGGLLAGGGWLAAWRSRLGMSWQVLSVAGSLAFFLAVRHLIDTGPEDRGWGVFAVMLALVHVGSLLPIVPLSDEDDQRAPRLLTIVTGATVALALATAFGFDPPWTFLGWAALLPLLAWSEGPLRLPDMRQVVAVVAGLVAAVLVFNPILLAADTASSRLFNWIPAVYLLAIAAAVLAARLVQARGSDRLAGWLDGLALGLITTGGLVFIRQLFHPGNLDAVRVTLAEWGSFPNWCLGLGWLCLLAHDRWPRPVFLWGGRVLAALGGFFLLIGPFFIGNPLWSRVGVAGPPIANSLLWIYGVPAVLLLLKARRFARAGVTRPAWVHGAAGLITTFALVTFQVRHVFRGARLDKGSASDGELYAYSAAWLVLGVAVLAVGVVRRLKPLRLAGLAVVSITVVKVFLIDTRELEGLWRVLSFLGLGLSLVGLGHVYQKVVSREDSETS
ncbi:MAG: DUF2339 domain-containing protein [Acidobacteriota bacterium]